ncbi:MULTISPECIES: AI-2E family transporter [Micrococcus]|uniref:AI-2E family transporter n=1 Tax=Micrococcus TaxID=1269 RepID=UPI001FD77A90|nr:MULTISPECIES: AI-2E family transporter [Micrococcus]
MDEQHQRSGSEVPTAAEAQTRAATERQDGRRASRAVRAARRGGTLRRLGRRLPRPRRMEFTVDDVPEPATEPGGVTAQAGADVVTGRADAPGERVGDGAPAVVLRAPVTSGFLLTAGVGLALLIFWMLSANWELIVWILAALFIALGLDPIVRKIESWGAPRPVGVLAAVLGLAGLAAAFLSLLVPTVVEQSAEFVNAVPQIVEDVMGSAIFHDLDREFQIRDAVDSQVEKLVQDQNAWSQVFGGLVGLGQFLINTAFSTLVVLVLTLYFLASLPAMKYWLYRLAPRSRRVRVEYLAEKITSSVGHYVMGQSFVALLNGTVAFVAMSIAGTPYAALLAFFAGMTAFIPLVGAMIGGLIITGICLTVDWQTAALFAAIYFVYLQIEAYVVSPRVMARAVAVPASMAVIAVIAGGTLLGVLGALMAIPTAAAVMILVREVYIPRQDRR